MSAHHPHPLNADADASAVPGKQRLQNNSGPACKVTENVDTFSSEKGADRARRVLATLDRPGHFGLKGVRVGGPEAEAHLLEVHTCGFEVGKLLNVNSLSHSK